jgi:16S rRNA (cytidine1402-2'-O)-methyltransferase
VKPGKLFLIPTPIGEGDLRAALPNEVIARSASLHYWIAENAKTCRAFLKLVGAAVPLAVPIQQQDISELTKHAALDMDALLAPLKAGHDVGLVSEAGAPAVADPGALVVAAAHSLGAEVVPMVGPSAILLGLMASGLNGQSFAFNGYLPKDAAARSALIKKLDLVSKQTAQTQLFIETPYRNAALFTALVQTLNPQTRLCVAIALGTASQWVFTATATKWRSHPTPPNFNDHPAMFAFLG